eukprot:503679_1
MAWGFIFAAPFGLMTLYFFISKIFFIFVIIFCLAATNGLSTIFSHFIDLISPNIQHTTYYLKRIDFQCNLSDILGLIPASIVSIVWYLCRQQHFAWILQDIMCVGLLLVLQRSIRLTNLKIASILLSTAFLYDIFWVFLSPCSLNHLLWLRLPTETLPV